MKDHKYIDMDYVRNNPNIHWDKYWLSHNKQLTVKDVETLILPNSKYSWDWYAMTRDINIQEVRNNPDKQWNKYWLSQNEQLTVKDVETLILPNNSGEWNWYYISQSINIQEVINNPHKPWNKFELKRNKGITDKILEFFNAGLLKHLQRIYQSLNIIQIQVLIVNVRLL